MVVNGTDVGPFEEEEEGTGILNKTKLILSFLKKNKFCFVQVVGGARLLKLWDSVPRDRFHHLGLSPMRPNELWTCPRDGAAMA